MKSSDPTMPPPGAARAVGSPLAGCSIEAVLHVGPVFTVYRAADAHGLERVALKEYCPQALCTRDAEGAPQLRDPEDPQAFAAFEAGRAAFVEELHTLQQLRLPGLVRLRGIVESEGSLCALMPLLPGAPLDRLSIPQDDEGLHALLLALLEPLAQLHAASLVHGALHAGQLLWAPPRPPVLLGLGLTARALGLASQEVGAPELDARSAHLPRGPWTDVYTLAAMVLHQLTGQPWRGGDGGDTVAVRLQQALGPAREPAQRQVLVKALEAALAPSPTDRPAHAGVLRDLLGGGEPATATPRPRARQPAATHAFAAPQGQHAAAHAFSRPRGQPAADGAFAAPQGQPAAEDAFAAPQGQPADGATRPQPHRQPQEPDWERMVPAFRQGDAFVMPPAPRQRNDSARMLVLTLLVGLGCGAMGWWVHGLWQEETERNRINQLIAQAAAPHAVAPPVWSDSPPSLPPLAAPVDPAPGAAEVPAAAAATDGAASPFTAAGARTEPLVTAGQADAAAPLSRPSDTVAAPAAPASRPDPATFMADLQSPEGAEPLARDAAALAPGASAAAQAAGAGGRTAQEGQGAQEGMAQAQATAAVAPGPGGPAMTVRPSLPAGERPAAPPRAQAAREPSPPARAEARPRADVRKQAPEPVRAASAKSAATPVRTGAPRNACAALNKYALLQCMQRQCNQSSWRQHPQCQRLIKDNVLSL
jgi:serine/threonine protein kinase